MEWLETLLKLSQVGSTGLLLVAVWGFLTGRVVPRWVYEEKSQEADEWRRLAQRGTDLADRSLDLARRPASAERAR